MYIFLFSKRNGTLYCGKTNNLERRMQEHKHKINDGLQQNIMLINLVIMKSLVMLYLQLSVKNKLKMLVEKQKLNL